MTQRKRHSLEQQHLAARRQQLNQRRHRLAAKHNTSGAMRRPANSHELLDKTFEFSVLLKGADGVLELIGGLILFFIKPQTIDRLVVLLTQHELSRDPHDFIANHILRSTAHLHSTQTFGAFYLLIHGLVKVALVWALLKKQLWAYPATIVIFAGFIVYQIYRITLTHSLGLVLLTLFDGFIIWLVWREYRVVRQAVQTHQASRQAA